MKVYTSLVVLLTTTLAFVTAAHGMVVERAPVPTSIEGGGGGSGCADEALGDLCRTDKD
ncbi:hypothetical protein BDN72DRAFT_900679 [Pluteus cervinus]|uniref:Uncharacterized protein n=1 Tax=Pluteus cervinus TaxID=181527 RepID=A0ACD3AIB7_9AGAR|nr:hypothetical protein BDN72DRAFT_900679 [Pluteus cervinus]